ncbi:PPOX class F420-dependent oxidoreductase [soil metagenome]
MMAASDRDDLWSLFGAGPRGVLGTLKRDGRPQLSNVGYTYDRRSRVALISVTDSRAKTRNLRRDPRASFHVSTPDLGAYAVGEGIAELSPVARGPHYAVVDALVGHYRAAQGEHPDWTAFRAAMVDEGRLLLQLPLTRVYGWSGVATL